MYQKIKTMSHLLNHETIQHRRFLHTIPETAWLEIQTSLYIIQNLKGLGYDLSIGKDVMKLDSRMGMLDKETFENYYKTLNEDVLTSPYFPLVKDGKTSVVGSYYFGPGPTIALRFDIDALPLQEKTNLSFSSKHPGMHHACGHDGHIAIGLSVAKILMELKEDLYGTVKLIFQSGEEGVRGAKCIVDQGVLDDVDYFISGHIVNSQDDQDVYPQMDHLLATEKMNVTIHGQSAHAGKPELGKNALFGACDVIHEMAKLPQLLPGTRLNVGVIKGGEARNIICDRINFEMEIRGETDELNQCIKSKVIDILEKMTQDQGLTYDVDIVGKAFATKCHQDFVKEITQLLQTYLPDLKVSEKAAPFYASEDVTYMMEKVLSNGGKATYMKLVSDNDTVAHHPSFTFNEDVLEKAVRIYSSIVYYYLRHTL